MVTLTKQFFLTLYFFISFFLPFNSKTTKKRCPIFIEGGKGVGIHSLLSRDYETQAEKINQFFTSAFGLYYRKRFAIGPRSAPVQVSTKTKDILYSIFTFLNPLPVTIHKQTSAHNSL